MERVNSGYGRFSFKASDVEVSGNPISFSTFFDTKLVKVTIKPTLDLSPSEIMKFNGKCEVSLDDLTMKGILIGSSFNFIDSTFELSFMPDGDT